MSEAGQSETPRSAVVIGAGQAGGPLAGALAKAGWNVTLIEREHVGGTCVNEGCTPTKAMIASARAAHLARVSAPLGVHAEVRVSLPEVVDRVQGIVKTFREGSENGLKKAGVKLVMGEARFSGVREVQVTPNGGGDGAGEGGEAYTLTADLVFVNTGASPRLPDLPGLKDAGAMTSKDILHLKELPAHLLILGGGYISLEFAQAYARLGSKVTVVEAGERLLPREDEDVAAELRRVLEDEGVSFLLGRDVTRVSREGERVTLHFGDTQVQGSHLLVAVGRAPNTATLNLEATGAKLGEHGEIVVDDDLLAAEGVYALGDVKGGPAFTHVSYDDFRIVRDALLHGRKRSYRDRLPIYTLFTDPQLGRVGLNRDQAIKSGKKVRVYTLPMKNVARAIEMGETAGLMRAVVDDASDRLLGVTVLGAEGGEVASALQFALQGGLTASVLRGSVISHPTLCESINNLFMSTPEVLEG